MATVGAASGGVAPVASTMVGLAGSLSVGLAASASLGPAGGSTTPDGLRVVDATGNPRVVSEGSTDYRVVSS